jgi:hypothetical protein
MNSKLFTTRNFKKDLNDYSYVKNLKTLHPTERNILFQKYKTKASKTFYTALTKAKTMLEVEAAFKKTLNKANLFIKNSTWHNPVINNKFKFNNYGRDAITIIGYEYLTDKQLIDMHKYHLKNKEEDKKRREEIKYNSIKSILTRCANKNDALSIIKVLKNKYKLSGTI